MKRMHNEGERIGCWCWCCSATAVLVAADDDAGGDAATLSDGPKK